jgi:hypothetical protein
MDRLLVILLLCAGVAISLVFFPEGLRASAICAVLLTVAILLINFYSGDASERAFLKRLFVLALLARLAFACLVFGLGLSDFFGGDAKTYDYFGARLMETWFGRQDANPELLGFSTSWRNPSAGMYYLTAVIYSVTGQNILAGSFFCAVFGAGSAVSVYFCTLRLFNNFRSAKTAAVIVAFFPSLIIWSSQMLKDGLIIFLLVLVMLCVLRLQEKLDYVALAVLVFSMFGILSMRFYVFYMLAVAVVGSFIIGTSNSVRSIARRAGIMIAIGIALTYLGILNTATFQFQKWGNLEAVQRSRSDLAGRAESGFGEDLDVSTTEGAISALPVGFSYLMFAPFPWQITNVRQAITLPEMLVWWLSIPLLCIGFWYTLKYRLRESVGILLFALMLTIAYSIFQGNVGTAYRQRAQIQVFHFMFIAVGGVILLERRENRKRTEEAKRAKFRRYREELQRWSEAGRVGDLPANGPGDVELFKP